MHKTPLYFILGSFQTIKQLLILYPTAIKIPLVINVTFACENEEVICLISSLMPARRTLMLCLWSEGSCSSLNRATFGGSGTGIWRAVTQHWRPVTGGGFPTTSMPPLKTSQGIFGSFKVGSARRLSFWNVVYGFMWAQDDQVSCTFRQV